MNASVKRLSKLFQPLAILPPNAIVKNIEGLSQSQKLLVDLGIIKPSSPGCYHLLPIGIRAIDKLIKVVERQMPRLNAQKIETPFLTNAELWRKTGRLNKNESNELFTLMDRHNKELILNPTNEELITDLISSVSPLSHRQLSLRLYQITSKFRDEMKQRFGLLRSRQFIMKDLYTFDSDLLTATETYETVCRCYERIFKNIGIPFLKVNAPTGEIGGTWSHEYHFLAPIGEDSLIVCNKCNFAQNEDMLSHKDNCSSCNNELNESNYKKGIEVGHTFLLGERYSKPLKATFLSKSGKPEYLQMGCYGLGISRILAASLEILSTNNELRWPECFVPFKVIIITPKPGSKEEQVIPNLSEELYSQIALVRPISDDIILDDRDMTIGKRLREAQRMGYPYIVVVGNKAANNEDRQFELFDLYNNKTYLFSETQLLHFMRQTFDNEYENVNQYHKITCC